MEGCGDKAFDGVLGGTAAVFVRGALVLLSPAIAVSPLAIVTNLHSLISWMPYFEKFKWQSILPEVDPFGCIFIAIAKDYGVHIHV